MGEYQSEQVTGLFTASVEKMRELVTTARDMGDIAIAMVNAFDLDSPLSTEEEQRRHELEQSPLQIVYAAIKGGGNAHRFVKKLEHRNIRTVRDVLAVGYKRLSLSEISRPRFIAAMNEAFPNEVFSAHPTPADVAKVCDRLEQITATVLGDYLLGLNRHVELPQDEYGNYMYERRWSIADILDETNPEPRRMLQDFERCRDIAMRFAAEFLAAQANNQHSGE